METHINNIQKYLHNGQSKDLNNRIEKLRTYVSSVLVQMDDDNERNIGILHLYGVSQACALIAMKRNQNVELATMAGMLHDLQSYKSMNTDNHAALGAELARNVLNDLA